MAEQLRAKDVKRVEPGRLSRLFKCQNQCCDTQDTRFFFLCVCGGVEDGDGVRLGILSAASTQSLGKDFALNIP